MKDIFSWLAIAMSVALCSGSCNYDNNLGDKFEDYSEEACIDSNGNMHLFSSSWTEKCQDCSCLENGVIFCCTQYGIPLEYDRESCDEVFVEKYCKYLVVRKENRRISCEVHSYSG